MTVCTLVVETIIVDTTTYGARLVEKVAYATGTDGVIGRATCEGILATRVRVVVGDFDFGHLEFANVLCSDRATALDGDFSAAAGAVPDMGAAIDAFGQLNIVCNLADDSMTLNALLRENSE